MSFTTIQRQDAYSSSGYKYYPVVIVGAGESGIAMGCRLKEKLGFDQFRIFDRQAGIGGTWWINRYPGVACDIAAIFYSFSFAPNYRWTTFNPPGREIVNYLEGVCEKYKIVDKIQLNTAATEARWLDEEKLWEITLVHLRAGTGDLSDEDRRECVEKNGEEYVYVDRETVRAKVLISAVGGLVQPKPWPENVPGRESFKGDILHSARWNHSVDVKGKDVVVVGTGCSAAQIIPSIIKPPFAAKSVTQLMRSPPWVMPQIPPPFGPENWEKWSPTVLSTVPGLARLLRTLIFCLTENDWRLFGDTEYNKKERKKYEGKLLEHMKKTAPAKYHDILTPHYAVGCKRRVVDGGWFPALHDPRVELTTLPLKSIQPHGVTLGPATDKDESRLDSSASTSGKQIPAEIIVLANGFDTGEWIHPLKVLGQNSKSLHDVWQERGGAQGYLGVAMDGFPNFFMIFGPNTATGHSSVILASENMVEYTLRILKPILKGTVAQVDVKHEAEMEWTRVVQENLKKTVFATGGCQNWYQKENGWNSVAYPYSQIHFAYRCMFPRWNDWNISYTSKGIRRRRVRRIIEVIAVAVMVLRLSQLRQKGYTLGDGPRVVRASVKAVVEQGMHMLITGLDVLRERL